MTRSWANGLQRTPDRLPEADLQLRWDPQFDDDPAAPAAAEAADGRIDTPIPTPDRAVEARGMTGSVGFDGLTVTIRIEEDVVDRSADRSVSVPIGEVDELEWIPASNTHCGVLRIARPRHGGAGPQSLSPRLARQASERSEVAFKVRQQPAFEVVREAIQQCLDLQGIDGDQHAADSGVSAAVAPGDEPAP